MSLKENGFFHVAKEQTAKTLFNAQALVQTEELSATIAGVATIFVDKAITKATDKITKGQKIINKIKGK